MDAGPSTLGARVSITSATLAPAASVGRAQDTRSSAAVQLQPAPLTVFKIEYHFVWVTKYRYKVLRGDVGQRVRELVRQTCEAFEIRILQEQ